MGWSFLLDVESHHVKRGNRFNIFKCSNKCSGVKRTRLPSKWCRVNYNVVSAPVSPAIKINVRLGSAVSTIDQGTGSDLELVPWVLSSGCSLHP